MILLNNVLNVCDGEKILESKYISSDIYPVQDVDKVGNLITVRYLDSKTRTLNNRYCISKTLHPEFTGENSGMKTWFMILRYDKVFPNKAILINASGQVIVTDTFNINTIIDEPGSEPKMCNIPPFENASYCYFNVAEDYVSFLNSLETEFVNNVKIQNESLLKKNVFTAYYLDILNKNYEDGAVHYTYKEKDFETVKEELIANDKNCKIVPDEHLKGYPYYYNIHAQDMSDSPRVAINRGFILSADINGESNDIVVAELISDDMIRFVLGSEAFIYANDIEPENINDSVFNLMANRYPVGGSTII